MNIFKGKEELEEMNKSDVIDMMKDIVNPSRTRGGIVHNSETNTVQRTNWRGTNSYDDELTSNYCFERNGTDMSQYRPKIDDTEYTWSELNRYPNPLLRILAYRLWQQDYARHGKYLKGSEEE